MGKGHRLSSYLIHGARRARPARGRLAFNGPPQASVKVVEIDRDLIVGKKARLEAPVGGQAETAALRTSRRTIFGCRATAADSPVAQGETADGLKD
jgi:hypothetical protein